MPNGFDPKQFDISKFIKQFDFGAEQERGQEFISGLTGKIEGFETLPAAASRIGQQLALGDYQLFLGLAY